MVHLLSTCAKFSTLLTFLTSWYTHVRVRIKRWEMLFFSENFVYVLNKWPLNRNNVLKSKVKLLVRWIDLERKTALVSKHMQECRGPAMTLQTSKMESFEILAKLFISDICGVLATPLEWALLTVFWIS